MRERIKSNTGEELWPKKGYAEKIRSYLKMSISNKFQVDITDTKLFPEAAKHWKSFCDQLVKEGRSETEHHCEVDPDTMEAINSLLKNVKEALEARGTEQYEEKLNRIPAELHHKLNLILQRGAMQQLILFEVRRGGEGIHELKKKDFIIVKDKLKDFDYIKHCKTEKDKNHQEGTNSSIYGCIPFMDFADNFNPGELFSFYMQFVPDDSTKPGIEGGFLFPKPRQISSKFDPHDPEENVFYEPNMKGTKGYILGCIFYCFYPTFQWERILSSACFPPSLTLFLSQGRQITVSGNFCFAWSDHIIVIITIMFM